MHRSETVTHILLVAYAKAGFLTMHLIMIGLGSEET